MRSSTISRRIRSVGPFRLARQGLHSSRRVSGPPELYPDPSTLFSVPTSPKDLLAGWTELTLCSRLTNSKPSAIFRLRSLAPPSSQLSGSSPPANLGIEIAPQAQIEDIAARVGSTAEGKGKEVAGRVDVGKVAEKVVKNVRRYTASKRAVIDHGQLFNYLHSFGGGEVALT